MSVTEWLRPAIQSTPISRNVIRFGFGARVGVDSGVGTIVSFVVAYASVAWLLRYVAGHTIRIFVWYRWALAAAIIIALSTGALAAT